VSAGLPGRSSWFAVDYSALGYWVVGWGVLQIWDEVLRCWWEGVMVMRLHAGLANVGVGFVLWRGSTGLTAPRVGSSTLIRVFHFFLVGREKRGKDGFCFRRNTDHSFLMLPYFYCLSGIGGCNAFCDYLFREGATLKTVVTPLSRSP